MTWNPPMPWGQPATEVLGLLILDRLATIPPGPIATPLLWELAGEPPAFHDALAWLRAEGRIEPVRILMVDGQEVVLAWQRRLDHAATARRS